MQVVLAVVDGIVAHPHHHSVFQLLASRQILHNSEHITQRLGRVHAGRTHAVIHWHCCPFCQFQNALMGLVANHDGVHHTGKHQGGVFQGLTPLTHMHGFGLQVQSVATQLVHGRLKGNASTRGRLVEHERNGVALQKRQLDALLIRFLQHADRFQHLQELLLGEVLNVDKVLLGNHRSPFLLAVAD